MFWDLLTLIIQLQSQVVGYSDIGGFTGNAMRIFTTAAAYHTLLVCFLPEMLLA